MRFYIWPFENINGGKGEQIGARVGPGIQFGADGRLHVEDAGNQSIENIRYQANGYEYGKKFFFPLIDQKGYIGKNNDPVQRQYIGDGPEGSFIIGLQNVKFYVFCKIIFN
jgi:hypothetical protein